MRLECDGCCIKNGRDQSNSASAPRNMTLAPKPSKLWFLSRNSVHHHPHHHHQHEQQQQQDDTLTARLILITRLLRMYHTTYPTHPTMYPKLAALKCGQLNSHGQGSTVRPVPPFTLRDLEISCLLSVPLSLVRPGSLRSQQAGRSKAFYGHDASKAWNH